MSVIMYITPVDLCVCSVYICVCLCVCARFHVQYIEIFFFFKNVCN